MDNEFTVSEQTQEPEQSVINGWTIDSMLGMGSSGVVYKVSKKLDVTEKTCAAMKIIELSEDGEKKINSKLSILDSVSGKPGCVHVDEYSTMTRSFGGKEHKYLIIRMELLEPLPESGMNEEDVLKMLDDVTQALCVCHSIPVLHRDIKPQNILKAPDGSYRLTDFGEAGEISTASSTTVIPVGTPLFECPEAHNMIKCDERGDIYSLGLSAYCMLNGGLPPFAQSREELHAALGKRLSGQKIPRLENIDPSLMNIIEKMCEFVPENRYKSAEKLRRDIAKLKTGKKIKGLLNGKLHILIMAAAGLLSAAAVFGILSAVFNGL